MNVTDGCAPRLKAPKWLEELCAWLRKLRPRNGPQMMSPMKQTKNIDPAIVQIEREQSELVARVNDVIRAEFTGLGLELINERAIDSSLPPCRCAGSDHAGRSMAGLPGRPSAEKRSQS